MFSAPSYLIVKIRLVSCLTHRIGRKPVSGGILLSSSLPHRLVTVLWISVARSNNNNNNLRASEEFEKQVEAYFFFPTPEGQCVQPDSRWHEHGAIKWVSWFIVQTLTVSVSLGSHAYYLRRAVQLFILKMSNIRIRRLLIQLVLRGVRREKGCCKRCVIYSLLDFCY